MNHTTTIRSYVYQDRTGSFQLLVTVHWPSLVRYAGPRAMRNQSRRVTLLNGGVKAAISPKAP